MQTNTLKDLAIQILQAQGSVAYANHIAQQIVNQDPKYFVSPLQFTCYISATGTAWIRDIIIAEVTNYPALIAALTAGKYAIAAGHWGGTVYDPGDEMILMVRGQLGVGTNTYNYPSMQGGGQGMSSVPIVMDSLVFSNPSGSAAKLNFSGDIITF